MPHSGSLSGRNESGSYDRKRFMLGADIGTTYTSGVFYLASASTTKLATGRFYPFVQYGSGVSDRKDANTQIPSVIKYESRDVKIGHDALESTASAGMLVPLFKLGLIDRPELAAERQNLFELIARLNDDLDPGREEGQDVNNDTIRTGHQKQSSDQPQILRKLEQVIADFLYHLFGNWRKELELHGYDERDSIELHCAVPAVWRGGGPLITLGNAIDEAASRANLAFHTAVKYWPEPEAALAYQSEYHSQVCFKKGQRLLIIDAGGGTTDLIVYIVTHENPFRVKEEIEGRTVACGSSLLDEGFRRYFQEYLDSRSDLENFRYKKRHVEAAVTRFREGIKGFFDGNNSFLIPVLGIEDDEDGHVRDSNFFLSPRCLKSIFDRVLAPIWRCVRDTIREMDDKGLILNNIMCVGGLSNSRYFQNLAPRMVDAEASGAARSAKWIWGNAPYYSIAEGALRCEMRPFVGLRLSSCSVGFVLAVKYNKNFSGHCNVQPERDPVDKQNYASDCLVWLVKKGQPLPASKTIPFCRHESIHKESITCTARLYMSETNTEDYYPLEHEKNEDCQEWGQVSATIDIASNIDKFKRVPTRTPRCRKKPAQDPTDPPRRSARLQEAFQQLNLTSSSEPLPLSQSSRNRSRSEQHTSGRSSAVVPCNLEIAAESTDDASNEQLPVTDEPLQQISESCVVNLQFELDVKDCMGTWTLRCLETGSCVQAELSLSPFLGPGDY